MLCPYCAHEKTRVVGTVSEIKVRRFRKCQRCGETFLTVEEVHFDEYWEEYARYTSEGALETKGDKKQKD